MLPQDQNPYYDSARDKPDRSEFASLRMPMVEKRPPAPGGRGLLTFVLALVAVVVIGVMVRRYFLS